MRYRLGIDVGGTFTDCVGFSSERVIKSAKVPTLHNREEEGIFEGIGQLARQYDVTANEFLANTDVFVFGTTVVTNTVLEYSGVNTGLITTKGFRDIIELRRGYKESMFDLGLPGPHQIVPRQKRLGVTERIDYSGKVIKSLDEDEVRQAAGKLKDLGVESIAVCLLFSFVNPVHEKRIRDIIQAEYPDIFVSLSCELLPQIREFERVSTTIINAYTTPKLKNYLERLEKKLINNGFAGELFVMQSNGGMMDVDYSKERGVEAVLSGPSGGIVAAIHHGELSQHNNLITVDMGGTSYDVCLIQNSKPEIGVDAWINRYRIATPMIDIHTIGAGGGSIAWIDDAGGLRVGPRSAGAYPGPACYGRGGEYPTVTDADIALGYLNSEFFLNGEMKLEKKLAEDAIAKHIAEPLDMDMIDAAHGIFTLANSAMTNAIRYVSVSRGRDPRDYALMAFGGAGPVHAGMQVKDLGIREIIVPTNAGILSAVGAMVSNLKVSKVFSYVRRYENLNLEEINEHFANMLKESQAQLGEMSKIKEVIIEKFADIRYVGQVQEVIVPIRTRTNRITEVNVANMFRDFHELHKKLYAFNRPDDSPEIISIRLDVIGIRDMPDFHSAPFQGESAEQAIKETRNVYFADKGFVETPIYDGSLVQPGNLIMGPAIIEEAWTSIVVYPDQEALLDQYHNYVIEIVS